MTILLLILFICLQYSAGCTSVAGNQTAEKKQASDVKQDTENVNGCDYFNGDTMEWSGDEVTISTVFMLYREADK